MKKTILICAALLLSIVCLGGCAPTEHKEAIVGEWIWRETTGGQLVYYRYAFDGDGTVEYQYSKGSSSRWGEYTYKLNVKSELVLTADTKIKTAYPYSFNGDFTVLTLKTIDGDEIKLNKNNTDE